MAICGYDYYGYDNYGYSYYGYDNYSYSYYGYGFYSNYNIIITYWNSKYNYYIF